MKPCRGVSVRFTAKEGAVDRVTAAPGCTEHSRIDREPNSRYTNSRHPPGRLSPKLQWRQDQRVKRFVIGASSPVFGGLFVCCFRSSFVVRLLFNLHLLTESAFLSFLRLVLFS
eukprot:scaffold1555_cov116-Alexandrium_tamarense.AAC.2